MVFCVRRLVIDASNSFCWGQNELNSCDFFSVSMGEAVVHIVAGEFSRTNKKRTARHNQKPMLVFELWRRLRSSHENDLRLAKLDLSYELELVVDDFGKPVLLVSGQVGPSVSFSYSGARLWASLCTHFEHFGLDAALPVDFGLDYPVRRVFEDEEYERCLDLTSACPSEAAALLWSAKEAVAKAAGYGFRLFSPLDVKVFPKPDSSSPFEFFSYISKPGRMKAKIFKNAPILVKSFKSRTEWISIAALVANE